MALARERFFLTSIAQGNKGDSDCDRRWRSFPNRETSLEKTEDSGVPGREAVASGMRFLIDAFLCCRRLVAKRNDRRQLPLVNDTIWRRSFNYRSGMVLGFSGGQLLAISGFIFMSVTGGRL